MEARIGVGLLKQENLTVVDFKLTVIGSTVSFNLLKKRRGLNLKSMGFFCF